MLSVEKSKTSAVGCALEELGTQTQSHSPKTGSDTCVSRLISDTSTHLILAFLQATDSRGFAHSFGKHGGIPPFRFEQLLSTSRAGSRPASSVGPAACAAAQSAYWG